VQALLDEASGRGGRPYIPRKDLEYFFDVGLRMLTLRNLVVLEQGRYRVAPGQEKMVAYYANSIIQFFEREDQEDSNGRSGDQKDDKRTSSS
jgi:hypothetical protein